MPHGISDWHRSPPAPLSTGRWVFPNPAGSERISATAFPTACAATGSLTSPHVAGSWQVGLPPSPPPEDLTMRRAAIFGTCAPARDSRKRHYAQSFLQATATLTQRPFAQARLCCPRRHRSYGLSRQSGALSATSRFAVIRRILAIRSGLGWAPDLPHFETSILSLVPLPLRRRALQVLVSDSFPQTLAFALFPRARHSQTPQLAMSTPRRGLLVGNRNDAAAIRLTLRPQGLLAPLDQPTSTPLGPGRRALVLPGFHAQGSLPGRAGYDYLGNRKTPRAGLSPAGSMLLWAARKRRS